MKDLIKALQIFLKYANEDYPTLCEHDCLWVVVKPDEVSKEDVEELDKLGFFVDNGDDCFKSYKYGSC